MDDNYNEYCPTDTIEIKPAQEVDYHLDITKWAVVKCIIPGKNYFNVFVENGDTIHLKLDKNDLFFVGSNAAGHQFSYQYNLLKEYYFKNYIDSLFNKQDTTLIDKIIDNPRLLIEKSGYFVKLDSIYNAKQISENCYQYHVNEMDYLIRSRLLNKYKKLISNDIKTRVELTSRIERITQDISSDSFISSYVCGNYFQVIYCRYLYALLNENSKHEILQNQPKDTFGPYSYYLVAKGKTQLSLLFDAFIVQFKYGINEFDRQKMYHYLNNSFPKSQSVKVLSQFMFKELKDTLPVHPVFIDSSTIHKLSDISKNEKLKNKIIFIDIWASWCMPCRAEFTHNSELETLLSQYPMVEKLYITIDKDSDSWKNAIQSIKLSGYHLIATNELMNEMRKKIYQSETVTVPQYILIDSHGNILNRNLPRPSEIKILKAELDKLIR